MSTNPQPPQPAQSAQSDTAENPQLNWAFPFTPVDGKADATDLMTYMAALASADDGFYPLGASGMWHGGVHFDENTAKLLKQSDGVRAIADGHVVAYRMDGKYPEQVYKDGRHAHYSTGFVLIRHELVLPPLPNKAAPSNSQGSIPQPASGGQATPSVQPASAAAASPQRKPAPDETLTFFSLYMHLTDYATYQNARTNKDAMFTDVGKLNLASMPYWEGDRYYRVSEKSQDKQAVPKPKKPVTPPPVYDPLGDFISDNYTVPPSPADDQPSLAAPVTGIRICDRPAGKTIGILPTGSEFVPSDTETHDGWVKIKSLRCGHPVSASVGQNVSDHAPWSWVPVDGLDLVVDANPLDKVVILKEPFKVKAGDVVGEPGHYLRYTDAKLLKGQVARSLLHLEVFAGPDLKTFVEKSRTRAKDLPSAKNFLEVFPGAVLVTTIPDPDLTLEKHSEGLKLVPLNNAQGSRWVLVQPKSRSTTHGHHPHVTFTNVGVPVWVEAKLANAITTDVVKGWTKFPLSLTNAKGPGADFREVFRRSDLDKLATENIAIDEKNHHWWNVTLGAKDGSTRQGWICEDHHPLTKLSGPWDWPGFELIDNASVTPLDMFKRHIHVTEQYLADEDSAEFEPAAMTVNASDMIVKLEQAIDANHDGKVTAQELKHAQSTPWIANAISHLVVRYESEWGGGLGKWEALSPWMKKLLWLWQSEIDRIGKLQWWDQAIGIDGLPTEPTLWHFHPIGLISNFQGASCDCAARFKKFSRIILNHEGGIVNNAADKGGLTNKGIAWPAWQKYAKEDLGVEPTAENLEALTDSQAETIYLKRYWEPKGFCKFINDRVALMTYDWTITSGGAVKQIQIMLNSKYSAGIGTDGGLGPKTIDAINSVSDQEQLLQDIATIRRQYYRHLVDADPSQEQFLKGWLKRVDDCLQVNI